MSNNRLSSFTGYYNREGFWKTIQLLISIVFLKAHVTRKINFENHTVLHFRRGSSDLPTFRQIFIDEEYNFQIPFQPSVILDLGANVGFASIYFSKKFPAAKIIAVEPEISNYHQLEKNVSSYANVEVMQAAVWSTSGEIDIAVNSKYGEWGASIFIEGKTSKVKAVTIPELMKNYKIDCIDILKIDIEGSEKEIFQSPGEWIHRVKIFVIELHDDLVPGCSEVFSKAITQLESYSSERMGENIIIRNLNLIKSSFKE